MASSLSKWIFQTAVFLLTLTFLIMMAEGFKCYQCAAADLSCKKGTKDQLRDCDCKTTATIPGGGLTYASKGCLQDKPQYGPAEWRGCYSLIGVERKDVKNKLTYSLLGCTYIQKTECETYDGDPMKYKETTCLCGKDSCNQNLQSGNDSSRAGQKLSPKSFLHIFPLIIIITGGILQKNIFN